VAGCNPIFEKAFNIEIACKAMAINPKSEGDNNAVKIMSLGLVRTKPDLLNMKTQKPFLTVFLEWLSLCLFISAEAREAFFNFVGICNCAYFRQV